MFIVTANPYSSNINQDYSSSVSIFQGNLTNISQMADVNTPAPADGEFLTWSSAVSAWVASSVSSFNKWIVDTSNGYLSNDIDTLYFDDVLLNATIDDRDTDTTYTNGTGISLVGNVFSLIGDFFSGAYEDLTGKPTLLSNFTDDLGNRGYDSLSNFTNDLGVINGTDGINGINGTDGIDGVNGTDLFTSLNETQFDNSTGVLNIKESWLTTLWNLIFSTKDTDDLAEGSTNLYDNQSWNESYADELYYNINNPNSYYNSTNPSPVINTSYYLVTNPYDFYNVTTAPIYINDTFAGNYSDFLTHISWNDAVNGTLYLSSNPYGFYNSTNPQTETDPLAYNGTLMFVSDWNATNTSYYLESNPYNFYNSTNPSPVINTSYYVDNTHGYYNSTNPQTVSDIWVNVSGDLMTGRLNISDELSIIGNYPLKWFDNTGVTQYAYMIANSGEFLFSALDVPMDFKYGNLGSNLGARMNTSGNWNFTQNLNVIENITADYFLGDGSQLTNLPVTGETDPLWTSNQSLVYLKSNPFNFYNSTNPQAIINTSYYLATNPFSFYNVTTAPTYINDTFSANYSDFLDKITWANAINGTLYSSTNPFNFYNSTDFDITDYYEKSNPFGFYNTTNQQTETDPVWTADKSDYSTTTASNLLYYGIGNTFGFYNSTSIPSYIETEVDPLWTGNQSSYSTKTVADLLYYGIGNPYSYYNSTNPSQDTTYSAGNGISLSITSFSVAGGTALTQDAGGLSVTADGITDTQLAYNTGQHLTTTSNPTFNNQTITNCITFDSGGTICSGS